MISPYVYPGLKLSLICRKSFPFIKQNNIKVTREEIIEAVCQECSVTQEQMFSKTRKREVVDGRKILSAALKIKHRMTLTDIGEMMGDRDHTTIRNQLLKFKDHCGNDDEFKRRAKSVLNKIGCDFQTNYINIVDNR